MTKKTTKGQFPSRKNEKTNVLRPVSKIYECASNKSFPMYNYLIRISMVLFMLICFYLALSGIVDLHLVLMKKLHSMLLGKYLPFLLSRLGWCVGGLSLLAVLCFDPETMVKMMAPSGASGERSGEGSGWSGSWIDRWLNQENASSNPRELEDEAGTSASAPHPSPEEAHDPNQVNEAPPLAQEAMPHNAPSVLELRHQLDHFASSFNRISMRSDYLIGLNERLGVYDSTPERRRQILEGMRLISALQGQERPNSGKKAGDALVDFIRKLDQQQD